MLSGQWCTQDIQTVFQTVDDIYENRPMSQKIQLFAQFNNTNYQMKQGDFQFFIADIFTMGIQYGHRTELCDMLKVAMLHDEYLMFVHVSWYAHDKGVKAEDYDSLHMRNTTIDFNKNVR